MSAITREALVTELKRTSQELGRQSQRFMNQRNKPLEINMIAGRVLQRSVLISCFLPSSTLLLRLNPSRVLAEVKEPLLYFSPVRRRGKAQSCTRKTETCKRRRKLYSPCIPSKISKGISVTLELMESKTLKDKTRPFVS